MADSLEAKRFKRDLYVDPDSEAPIRVTPTGDLPLVEGVDNLRHALRRRIITTPGTVIHRPDYGAGVQAYVGVQTSQRSQMANAIRKNMLRDSRVEDCSASVALGSPGNTKRANCVTVDLRVKYPDLGEDSLTLVV